MIGTVITFISEFIKDSIIMSMLFQTIYGLIRSTNEAFFMMDEEQKIIDAEREEEGKNIEQMLNDLDELIAGAKDKINSFRKWRRRHVVLSIFVTYILCVIPIVNVAACFMNIKCTIRIILRKLKIIFTKNQA